MLTVFLLQRYYCNDPLLLLFGDLISGKKLG